jgi:GNAT superfamily N-acetyltransferase
LLAQLHPDDPAIDRDTATTVWQAILGQPGRQILLAELDGAVVGSIDCMTMANLTRGARPYVLVENVVVDAAHRRRGIASRLLDEAIEIGRAAGAGKVQLATGAGPAAEALYVRAGFTERAQGVAPPDVPGGNAPSTTALKRNPVRQRSTNRAGGANAVTRSAAQRAVVGSAASWGFGLTRARAVGAPSSRRTARRPAAGSRA